MFGAHCADVGSWSAKDVVEVLFIVVVPESILHFTVTFEHLYQICTQRNVQDSAHLKALGTCEEH